jgi:signal peptide peptidase SppA
VETFSLDLQGIDNIPHLSQWCGPWAMLPDQVMLMSELIRGLDISAHLANVTIEKKVIQKSAINDPANDRYYGYYTQTVNGIAHISLSGTLMKHVSSLSEGASTVLARRDIRKAAADSNVRGIMLSFDSPGGTVAGTRDLANEIAAAANAKPLHGYAEDLAASAAYWGLSQASRISANATAIVGSIGTFVVINDLSQMAEKEGIKVHVVKAGEFKGTGVPGTEVTKSQLAEMQRVVNNLNEQFLEGIAQGRKFSMDVARSLNDGRVHVGAEAIEMKLVDAIGTYEEAVAELESAINSSTTSRSLSMTTTAPKADAPAVDPKATEPTTAPVQTAPVVAPAAAAPVVPAAIDARGELKRYMADFGSEAGAKYFADGLDYSAAQTAHIKALNDQLAAANTAKVEAESKLASMNTGEKSAIDTGKPQSGQGAKGFESLFKMRGDAKTA